MQQVDTLRCHYTKCSSLLGALLAIGQKTPRSLMMIVTDKYH